MNSDLPQAALALRKKIQKKAGFGTLQIWGKQRWARYVPRDQSEEAKHSMTVVEPDGSVQDCLSTEAEDSTALDGQTPYMEDSCPICQDQFNGIACGAEVLLPCQHVLCKDCSSAWETCGQETCPLCREVIGASAEVDDMACYSTAAAVPKQKQESKPVAPDNSELVTHDLSGRAVLFDESIFEQIRKSVLEARHRRMASASIAAAAKSSSPATTAAAEGRLIENAAMEWPPAALASHSGFRHRRLLTNPEPGTTFCKNPKCIGCKERRTAKQAQEISSCV